QDGRRARNPDEPFCKRPFVPTDGDASPSSTRRSVSSKTGREARAANKRRDNCALISGPPGAVADAPALGWAAAAGGGRHGPLRPACPECSSDPDEPAQPAWNRGAAFASEERCTSTPKEKQRHEAARSPLRAGAAICSSRPDAMVLDPSVRRTGVGWLA